MSIIKLLHGTDHIIEQPDFLFCNPKNDYRKGFIVPVKMKWHKNGLVKIIQMYKQKVNNIDKAQGHTLYKLSKVLGCNVEDLLENPME